MKTNAKVYVMVDNEGRIKLGHSVNPAARSKQMPRPVTLVHETDVIEQAERVERLAHRILALHGTHLRGEWFEASLEDALQAIEIAIRQAEQEELALGGRLDGKADIEISRYPDERAVLVPVRLPPDLIDQLDAEAKARVDRPSRSALIRELLAASLRRIRR